MSGLLGWSLTLAAFGLGCVVAGATHPIVSVILALAAILAMADAARAEEPPR